MPTRQEILVERTFKQDGIDVEKRVFYSLMGEANVPAAERAQTHRNSKAIALLFKILAETGAISEDQLDEILLQVTWG